MILFSSNINIFLLGDLIHLSNLIIPHTHCQSAIGELLFPETDITMCLLPCDWCMCELPKKFINLVSNYRRLHFKMKLIFFVASSMFILTFKHRASSIQDRKHRGCIIPQTVTHSLVLLKMGKIIARNMLSWLELLISRYCFI